MTRFFAALMITSVANRSIALGNWLEELGTLDLDAFCMTATDVAAYISTIAAVVGAAYAALSWHRPKASPIAKGAKTARRVPPQPNSADKSRWSPFWPIVLVVIGWGAVAFDFIDRHWLVVSESKELPLSKDNARVDVKQWQRGISEQRQLFINVFIINRGENAAIGMQHYGIVAYSAGLLPEDGIKEIFDMIKSLLRGVPSNITSEIIPGQDGQFFSIFSGQQLTEKQAADIDSGVQYPYFINLMRYKDKITGGDGFIYTESCVYFMKEVLHYCESGHNRSYISN